jgi:hypothetical protein
MYGWRGKVTEIIGFDDNKNVIAKPYTPENYPTKWWVYVKFVSPINSCNYFLVFDNWPEQLEVVQKKFIDIENLREHDEVIGQKEDGTDIIRKSNAGEFDVSDIIQITTKIDGANASIAWDETTQKLEIFSRTNLLNNSNSLRGFYDYIKTQVEPKTDWSIYSDFVFFGEWCIGHSIKSYNKDWFNKWRIYDIWCKSQRCYISQERVKATCKQLGLEYIEELYYGPFIGWEHCRSFMHMSTAYGPDQEGIVVKNQTKLGNDNNRLPIYLKIVNNDFKESQHYKKEKKPINIEKQNEFKRIEELMSSVLTDVRINKILLKCFDENLISSELTPKSIGPIIKVLTPKVYEDLIKEEMEIMSIAGNLAGKIVSKFTADYIRRIILK